MTHFLDGPAMDKNLMLKNAPKLMRVVVGHGFDALDAPTDRPKPDEQLCVYELVEFLGRCHIRAAGGRSGFYVIANYRMATEQPGDAVMRDQTEWEKWCDARQTTK